MKSIGGAAGFGVSLLAGAILVACAQEDLVGRDDGGRGGGGSGGSAGAPSAGSGPAGTAGALAGAGGTPGSGGYAGAGGATAGGTAAGAAGLGRGGSGGASGAAGSAGVAASNAGSAGSTGGGAGEAGALSAGGASGSAGTGGAVTCPSVADFVTWPTGDGPADVGALVADEFQSHTDAEYGGDGYSLAFTWFGSLVLTHLLGDTQGNGRLISEFSPYLDGTKTVPNDPDAGVDNRAFGMLPLEIYLQNGDESSRELGLARATAQWATLKENGQPRDTRYWIDDMYMITGLQVRAYRATGEDMYLERSAALMLDYIDVLQNKTDKLYSHTEVSKAHWGRANGWVAAGMTELLLDLPAGSQRDGIMTAFLAMLDALLPLQITDTDPSNGNDDGCWRQVLDLPSANPETSVTAMFTYALATAARNGWVKDPKYAAAARRGWLALAEKTDAMGKLDRVCPGTGAAAAGDIASQQQFYARITLAKGDLHGHAPLTWAANAFLRSDCPGLR